MTKNKYNKSDLYIRVIRIIAGFVKSLIKILTKIRSNLRANERRGSSLTIPNAAESQEYLIPRLVE